MHYYNSGLKKFDFIIVLKMLMQVKLLEQLTTEFFQRSVIPAMFGNTIAFFSNCRTQMFKNGCHQESWDNQSINNIGQEHFPANKIHSICIEYHQSL